MHHFRRPDDKAVNNIHIKIIITFIYNLNITLLFVKYHLHSYNKTVDINTDIYDIFIILKFYINRIVGLHSFILKSHLPSQAEY